jgi:AraC-like DNA-binding protein
MLKVDPQVHEIWWGDWPAHTLEPARYLYDHELVLVMKGGCRIEVDGKSHDLTAGEGLIVPPGRQHLTATSTEGVSRFCAHFHWTPQPRRKPKAIACFFPATPRRGEITLTPSFIPKESLAKTFTFDSEVRLLAQKILAQWPAGDGFGQALCRVHLLEMLTRLFPEESTSRRQGDAASRLAYLVKDLLERENTVPVQELLPTLGFSYAHLCRIFRNKFGVTPVDYRNAIRLERAQMLLKNPLLTIAEVAHQTGFSDPAYFTRLFRMRHGRPPSVLR